MCKIKNSNRLTIICQMVLLGLFCSLVGIFVIMRCLRNSTVPREIGQLFCLFENIVFSNISSSTHKQTKKGFHFESSCDFIHNT